MEGVDDEGGVHEKGCRVGEDGNDFCVRDGLKGENGDERKNDDVKGEKHVGGPPESEEARVVGNKESQKQS
jgi:hypothetical protein